MKKLWLSFCLDRYGAMRLQGSSGSRLPCAFKHRHDLVLPRLRILGCHQTIKSSIRLIWLALKTFEAFAATQRNIEKGIIELANIATV
jgi:hypothetical protein